MLNIIEEYKKGKTLNSLSKTTGISIKTISNYLKINNIQVKDNRIFPESIDKIVVEEYNLGLSASAVGAKLGISKSAVLRRLKRLGIKRTYEEQKNIRPQDIEIAIQGYKNGMGSVQAGALVGVSCQLLDRWLRERSITKRSYSESKTLNHNRSKRGIQGIVNTRFGNLHFDSMYELARIIQLEKDLSTVNLERCSFQIIYNNNHRYNPDFLVTYKNGVKYIEEIKPFNFINREDVLVKKKAGEEYAFLNKMLYRIITEMEIGKNSFESIDLSKICFKKESDTVNFARNILKAKKHIEKNELSLQL